MSNNSSVLLISVAEAVKVAQNSKISVVIIDFSLMCFDFGSTILSHSINGISIFCIRKDTKNIDAFRLIIVKRG